MTITENRWACPNCDNAVWVEVKTDCPDDDEEIEVTVQCDKCGAKLGLMD